MQTTRKCPKCGKHRNLNKFTIKSGECIYCYRKKIMIDKYKKHSLYIDLVDSTCPMCRKKHKAQAKWKYCLSCSRLQEVRDYTGVIYI